MADRTCAVCSQPMPLTSRSDATMCSNACRTWRRRHPGVPRPIGPQSYTCEQCAQRFTRPKVHAGKRPRFCTDRCWEAYRHRQRPWGYWLVADPYPSRPFVCHECGIKARDSGIGPPATLCSHCQAERDARSTLEWQRANPERHAERTRVWARENPEARRAYYERNKTAIFAGIRRYRDENPEMVRAWKRDREQRRSARITTTQIEAIKSLNVYDRDQWVCQLCLLPVDSEVQWPDPMSPSLDHVVPLSRGGGHVLENVQLAHLVCNMQKGAALP